ATHRTHTTVTARKPDVHAANLTPSDTQRALQKQYYAGCHNDTAKTGNMTLTSKDLTHVEQTPELTEKNVKKLRAGLMPPPGAKRPEKETVKAFVTTLESTMDRTAALRPNPGSRPFQRLTRTEYA